MADEHGGIFPFRIMHVNLVHISEPSLCLEVISSPEMDKEKWTYNSIATVRASSPIAACRYAEVGKCVG